MDRIPEEKKNLKRELAKRTEGLLSPAVARWIILFASSALAAILLSRGSDSISSRVYEPGQVAEQTIKARDTYRILDKEVTAQRRDEAAQQVRSVYRADTAMIPDVVDRMKAAFSGARDELAAPASPDGEARESLARKRFAQELGDDVSHDVVEQLESSQYSPELESATLRLLSGLAAQLIAQPLPAGDRKAGITVLYVRREVDREQVFQNTDTILQLDDVPTRLATLAETQLVDAPPKVRATAVALASSVVRANLTPDLVETEARRKRAREAVAQVYLVVQKGRIIIEAGHEVTAGQLKILEAIQADSAGQRAPKYRFLGLFILAAGVFGGMYFFGSRFTRRAPTDPKDLTMLASLVVLGLLFAKVVFWISQLPGPGGPIPVEAWPFLVPIPAVVMMSALLFSAEVAAFVAVTVALLAAQMFEGSLAAMTAYFLASIAAASALETPRQRLDVFKAGGVAAGATVAVVAAFLFTSGAPIGGREFWRLMGAEVTAGLAGTTLAAIIAIGAVPAYEWLGYVTNFSLLELGSLNQPLLRELNLRAPGTYNHSVAVGSLAEAAAEAVGANHLFARVACYYHDIGKMRKPLYFIENQQGGENRHDKLSPSMSALIVEAHVKDGYEMALAHGLPKPIADIIPQHHGTRLISFFYNRARQLAEEAGEDPDSVMETEYRYEGPKPQTREAGIIMLADGCEAATRSIADPTPARIEGMIRRVFNMVWTDGQLDECDLTLRDLGVIAASFKKSLLAIHHHRVAYPQTKDISGKRERDERDRERPDRIERADRVDEQDRQVMVSQDFSVIPLPREPKRKDDTGASATQTGGNPKKKDRKQS